MTLLFCLFESALYTSAKLDSLEIISAAAFHIIPRIEFLLLDWIYQSIRIMTVYTGPSNCLRSLFIGTTAMVINVTVILTHEGIITEAHEGIITEAHEGIITEPTPQP